MKIVKQSLRERAILDGSLYTKARLTLRLAPDAMKLFTSNRERLRDSFGLLRLDWMRFVDDPDSRSKKALCEYTVANFDTEYELTLLGSGEMDQPAASILNWLSAVSRLTAAEQPPMPTVNLNLVHPHPHNPRLTSLVVGIDKMI